LYFVGQSLLKYRLLDLQEILGRGLVLTAIALILALVFWVLVLWTGGSEEFPLFHTFVASFVILILFEPLRDKLEGSTKLLFFRERFELRGKLEDLRREIANVIDQKRMTEVLLDTLYDRLRMTHTSVYLQDEGGASYRLVGHRGNVPPARLDVASHRTFFDQLRKTPTVILGEAYERQLADRGTLADVESPEDVKHFRQVLETLAVLKAGVCIPFVGQKNEILGLWNLFDESAAEGYSTEEIARMLAVGEQAAIVIENSRMFAKVRERDRLAVLGQMSAGLAHEIRNPLGAIKGAAQYLDPTAVPAEYSEFLKIIIEEADRLNHVVDQFLDYARPLKPPHAPTDLRQLIHHSLKLVGAALEAKNIVPRVEAEDGLPSIQANGQQLTQVLVNLLNNAVEALPAGGALTVRLARSRDQSSFWPGSPLRSGAVEVQIVDSGAGIAQESLDRIFVPFFTTKDRGTGLGLAICQRIVENHSGEMRVQSKIGEGSTFTVYLPLSPAAESGSNPPPAEADPRPASAAPPDGLPFPEPHGRG
jgi:signal transduction histidine kinase